MAATTLGSAPGAGGACPRKEASLLRAVEGLMYLAPACSFWLLLGVAVYEWPRMAEANALGLIAAKPLLYLAAAAMGFGVNSLAYIVIQLASSLTLKVSLYLACSPMAGAWLLEVFFLRSKIIAASRDLSFADHIVAQSGRLLEG